MTIFEGSRYEFTATELVLGADGNPRTVLASPTAGEAPSVLNYTTYTVQEGDRIDILGQRFFGSSELWWAIADANPNFIYWDNLPVGLVIRVPSG